MATRADLIKEQSRRAEEASVRFGWALDKIEGAVEGFLAELNKIRSTKDLSLAGMDLMRAYMLLNASMNLDLAFAAAAEYQQAAAEVYDLEHLEE